MALDLHRFFKGYIVYFCRLIGIVLNHLFLAWKGQQEEADSDGLKNERR